MKEQKATTDSPNDLYSGYNPPHLWSNGKYVRVKFKDSPIYFDFFFLAGFNTYVPQTFFSYVFNTNNKFIVFISHIMDNRTKSKPTELGVPWHLNYNPFIYPGDFAFDVIQGKSNSSFYIKIYYMDENNKPIKSTFTFHGEQFKKFQSTFQGQGKWKKWY